MDLLSILLLLLDLSGFVSGLLTKAKRFSKHHKKKWYRKISLLQVKVSTAVK